ncbi:hypothetical protein MRX96_009809 [Rhipicephalus microplus]
MCLRLARLSRDVNLPRQNESARLNSKQATPIACSLKRRSGCRAMPDCSPALLSPPPRLVSITGDSRACLKIGLRRSGPAPSSPYISFNEGLLVFRTFSFNVRSPRFMCCSRPERAAGQGKTVFPFFFILATDEAADSGQESRYNREICPRIKAPTKHKTSPLFIGVGPLFANKEERREPTIKEGSVSAGCWIFSIRFSGTSHEGSGACLGTFLPSRHRHGRRFSTTSEVAMEVASEEALGGGYGYGHGGGYGGHGHGGHGLESSGLFFVKGPGGYGHGFHGLEAVKGPTYFVSTEQYVKKIHPGLPIVGKHHR